MEIIIVLICTALLLFFLEIFMPGMVLFIIGGGLLLAASVVAFVQYDALVGTLVFLSSGALSVAMFFVEIKVLSKTRIGKGLMLKTQNNEVSNPPVASGELVGKSGEAITIMAPSGFVLVDNKKYQAYSKSGHIDRGQTVRVVGQDAFKITVEVA